MEVTLDPFVISHGVVSDFTEKHYYFYFKKRVYIQFLYTRFIKRPFFVKNYFRKIKIYFTL